MDKPKIRTRLIFEAAAFREVANPPYSTLTLQAFLCKNSTTDPDFCGLWALPRLFYLHGEKDEDVAKRFGVEFGAKISRIWYASLALDERHNETLFSNIFIVHLASNPLVDAEHQWFSLDNLPLETAKLHRKIILPRAVDYYKQLHHEIAP